MIVGAVVIGTAIWLFLSFQSASVHLAEDTYERARNEGGTFEDVSMKNPLDEEAWLSLKADAGVTQR